MSLLAIDAKAPAFRLPAEPTAWWGFLSASFGGLMTVELRAPGRIQEALALSLSGAALFLASDWVSSLGGKSLHGDVPKASWRSLPGLALLATAAGFLAAFRILVPAQEAWSWDLVLAGVAVLVALMFLMRLEMVPLDSRLLLISGILSTLPALMLGYLALRPDWRSALVFWAPPAIYFPVSVLFSQTWIRGLSTGRRKIVLVVAPLLPVAALSLAFGRLLPALFILAYLAWILKCLLSRFDEKETRLPQFSAILKVSRTQSLFHAVAVVIWLRELWLAWG